MRYLVIGVCAFMAACSGTNPATPTSVAAVGPSLSDAVEASTVVPPRFNLQAILRGDGFGLVALRQERDPAQNITYLDLWVRDLLPNTSYSLQRAVDAPQDGVCTGTNWLSMGQGTTPHPILTDDTGTGRAELWRAVPATAAGSDIHFRVIQTGTSIVALHSDCYKLLVRD